MHRGGRQGQPFLSRRFIFCVELLGAVIRTDGNVALLFCSLFYTYLLYIAGVRVFQYRYFVHCFMYTVLYYCVFACVLTVILFDILYVPFINT